jgi:toxoflavin synthase
MSTNYNAISLEYGIANRELAVKKYAEKFTFLNLIGDVKGKTVLDLACGEGRFTREIKKRGARHVVGVDISEAMIGLARTIERKNPVGAEYIVCDVVSLGKIGTFDIVSAAFLFCYASSQETLLAMCRTAYDHLKSGGRLAACVNATPLYPPGSDITRKYGYIVKSPLPLHEGDPVEYSFFTDRCSFSLVNYHWSKETYERMLRKSGFTEITWQTPIVSQRGLEKYGVGFWKDFLKEPNFVCIGCA